MTDATDREFRTRTNPQTLRLRSIAPTLTVSDIEASLAWYRDVVGFLVQETWEQDGKVVGAALLAGTSHVMIVQDDWEKGRDRHKGEGMRLYLNTAQNIDEVATAIRARGGTLASDPEDMPWGVRAFNLVDPDGFRLTISSL